MIEPEWLTVDVIVEMHSQQLERFGGPAGIRDVGLLESACARPLNQWAYGETRLCALAAAYAFGLARNHPFIDGNKRIAFQAMYVFLALNGQRLTATARNAADTIIALAAGELSEGELAGWIRAHVAAAPDKDA